MKKRILSMLLAIVMVVGLVPGFSITASAATTGTTGEVNWSFDETTGTLTVSGTGAMADYTSGSQPWYAYKDSITTVIVEKGVTTISTNAFSQFPVLKTVKIAGSVTAIGNNAFYSCSNLTTVEYYGSSAPQASSNVFLGVYAVVKVLTTYEGNVFCGKMARATLDAANEPVSSAPDETPPAAPTPHNASSTIYVFECSNTGLSHQSIGIAFDSNYSKAGEPFKNADSEWIVEVTNNVKAMWENHMSGIYEHIYPDYAHTPRVELPEELTVTLTWDPEMGMWKYDKDYVYYDISCEPLTATYTVTVTDDGNGTASANPASGAECTEVSLTATPNEGYQFKEWQVLSGDVIVTDDTFTIGTANVEIKAVFEEAAPAVDYSLWIGGTRVTSLNASDVFGDGKVSYDPESNTLTLNNYSYEGEYIWSDGPSQGAAIRYEGTDTLKLVLNGESSVTYSGRERDACYGLYSKKSLVISGDGALTATATPDYGSGVYVENGGITVESGSLTGTGYFYGIDADTITVNGGTVEATGGSQAFYVEPTIAKTLAVYDAEDQVIENPVWTGIGALTYAKIATKPVIHSVQISAVDATDGWELAGAHLQILNTAGDVIVIDGNKVEWDSTMEAKKIEGLKTDTAYTLRATVAPDGYTIASDTTFRIDAEGNVTSNGTVDAYGTILVEFDPTVVQASAVDIADGEAIAGATMQILDKDGNVEVVVKEWVSTTEAHTVTGLLTGEEYILRATVAPDGYTLPTDTTFAIDQNGNIKYTGTVTEDGVLLVEFERTMVKVSAVETGAGEAIEGAHMQILDVAGDVVTEWVSAMDDEDTDDVDESIHLVYGLKTGVAYTLHATVAPSGYTIADDVTFTIGEDGQLRTTGDVTEEGIILSVFDITVVQFSAVDTANGSAIAGATMQILDEDSNLVEEWVCAVDIETTEAVNESIHMIFGLETDVVYTLRAVAAPDGHTIPTDTTFSIDEQGNVTYSGKKAQDGTLLVEFTKIEYTITYVLNGGTINGEYATSYAFGDSVSLPQNVTREGYYFDGWYDESGNGAIMGFGRPETGDKTFYAHWTPKATWTDGDGGSYEKEFDYGAVITIPTSVFFEETFRKTGYTLTGWQGYTEGMTMPLDGVTFTAIYTANDYTVSFDANGGAAIDPITVTYGEKYGNLPSSAITGLSGGNKNWYLVDKDGNVTDTNIKKLTKVETARDHTLFIKRTVLAPTVKITLEVPGAISNDYQYYVPGNSTRVLTATVSNENKDVLDYTYQWYKDGEAMDGATEAVLTLGGNVSDTGTYKVVVTATLKADSDIVVTANSASAEKEQAVKILHAANTLSYDANGGENAPGSHYTGGETITVASDEPSREHYTFAGWNTKADGSGSSYSAGSTYTFAEDNGNGGCEVTLYAQWTANTYAVTLETNRGTIREGNVTEYAYGVGAKLPTAVTRPGCRFVGWYDNEAFKGDPVTEITTTDHGDKTFYAKWKKTSSGASEPIYIPENDGHRDCPLYSYVDLNWNGWYHDGIHFCLEEGLMNGISATRFAPDSITTRAMIVTILWRLEREPVVENWLGFSDVSDDMWYTEAIRWAASEDIAEGYGDIFGPNDPITREQMAAIMWRYAKYKGYDVSVGENTNILSYDDAFDVSDWAIPAMQWACGAGLINGVESGRAVYLKPADNTTRAQAAAILQRFCEKELGK